MGFFSWLTCDTRETIWNAFTDRCRPVYMLRPDGEDPIPEPAYEGYGEFGGVDAYEQLYLQNRRLLPGDLQDLNSAEDKRLVGIALDYGDYYLDRITSRPYIIFHRSPLSDWLCKNRNFRFFPGNYSEAIPELGLSANDLIDQGRFEGPVPIRDLVIDADAYKPLKFSFDGACVYEDCPPSDIAENQGYFDE